MTAVECLNLNKSYKQIAAVQNLSLQIEANKITGLIGRNGAGKTTLLKLMAGYLRPTSGEVRIFSRNPFKDIRAAASFIFIDDQMAFPFSFTLRDILEIMGRFYPAWDKKLAYSLLDYFSLNPVQFHNALSKGTKSTFNSILGLAAHCPLTIFDEPTTGMDSAVRKDFYRALLKDYVALPRSIILSSHLVTEIEDLLEEVVLLKAGTKCLQLDLPACKEYAVSLRGNAESIEKILPLKEIIHQETFGQDSIYIVKKDTLSPEALYGLKKMGINVSPVPVEELYIHLTAKTRGGIDDVFSNN